MTTPDPRLHGPPRCPRAPAGCEACSGFHHWLDSGFDPENASYCTEENLLSGERAVLDYDREHGTEHALAFFGCKHCDAWAECEYVWELEEAQELDESPWPTTVVNLHREPYDVYIGRAGHGHDGYFGNPFRICPAVPRDKVLARFHAYFLERLAEDPEFRRRVLELRGKRLGCFCKPLACHGDVIAAWLDSQPVEDA